ncbi:hypothetical protein HYV91_00695 [Candidatus Wolfebacteria bacterium]|nr:hypothetical protein [Candidatus Wolfebacteria bacterium]
MAQSRTRPLASEEEEIFQKTRRGMNPNNYREIYDLLLTGNTHEMVVGRVQDEVIRLHKPINWISAKGHKEARPTNQLTLEVFRSAVASLNGWFRSKGTRLFARTESRGKHLVVSVGMLFDDEVIVSVASTENTSSGPPGPS